MTAPVLSSREYARLLVLQAPPLTEEQKAILRVLFRRPVPKQRAKRQAA